MLRSLSRLAVLVLCLATTLPLCLGAPAVQQPEGSAHLRLGNPSGAKADPDNPDPENYLLVKPLFALSYNNKKGAPNWVSWRLVKNHFGDVPRKGNPFHPDSELPKGFFRAKPTDYKFAVTGMTRGHLCPNADRDRTKEDAAATFVMTNMVPQTQELNGGAWKKLESYCRQLAGQGKELYIVAGPAGQGGRSKKGFFLTTPNKKIVVPSRCWKVVLVLDPAEGDPAQRVDENTRVISVIMPNDQTPEKKPWKDYLVKMSDVETLTGYKFFDRVPAKILDVLRDEIDEGTEAPGGGGSAQATLGPLGWTGVTVAGGASRRR